MGGGREVQTFPAYALSNSLHSGRSEFLLRAPPSDSKVCLRALSLSPPREILHVMPLCAQGFGTCRLAGGLACGLPVPAYCAGVLVACLVVTARVQREQRPGAGCLGDARPSWLCTLLAVPWASHGAHASVRHALRCVQKRLCAISFALETCLQYER